MRRSRRFRRIFRKVNIFVVVFVAFVNACIYCPVHSLAANVGGAETLMSVSGIGNPPYTYITGQDPNYVSIDNITWNPDSSKSLDVRFYIVGLDDSSFSNGNYFVWSGNMLFWSSIGSDAAQLYLDPTVYTTIKDHNPNPLDDVTFSTGATSRYYYANTFGIFVPVMLSGSYDEFLGSLSFEFSLDLEYWGVSAPTLDHMYFRLDTQSLMVTDNQSQYEDVLTQIKDNTGATTDAVNNGFNETMNGYDSSTGNQVASDFESGAASYDQAEDNLFNSADSALTGFKFFDFSTFGSITTGLSFVSGIMTSIYNNFGAMQGLGIVLSVLFSVMFMAIVIGFYRYFK